jgi:hypothetical protein
VDIGKWLLDFFESFKTTPLGVAILFSLLVVIVLLLLIWLRTIQVADARDKREADLEEQRIESQKEDDKRRATNDARLVTAVESNIARLNNQELLLGRFLTILERMDSRNAGIDELLRSIHEASEANAIKTTAIHKDLRSSSINLAGKLDGANNESRTRWENTQIVMNNRAQEIQKTVHSTATGIQDKLTEQNSVLDQMLSKLGELSKEVTGLRGDFRENATSQAAAIAHKEDERFTSIQNSLRELATGLMTLKKRGTSELDPNKVLDPVVIPTISEVVDVKPLVSAEVGLKESHAGHIPKKQTDQLTMPPDSTITPVSTVDMSKPITGTFATPTTTGNEETQKLDFSKLTEDKPHA